MGLCALWEFEFASFYDFDYLAGWGVGRAVSWLCWPRIARFGHLCFGRDGYSILAELCAQSAVAAADALGYSGLQHGRGCLS